MSDITAESTARKFFDAYRAGDMSAVVEYICENAIDNMAYSWRARAQEQHPALSAEQYMTHDSEMPREVAQYLAARDVGWRPYDRQWWEDELPGTASAEELLSAPANALAARFFASLRTRDSGAGWQLDWNVLGSVADGPDQAYVVFRCAGGKHRCEDGHVRELMGDPRLLKMRRTECGWCVADPSALQSGGGAWIIVEND